MSEILAFVSGCLFTLLLAGGCLALSYRVLEYKETTGVRRTEKAREVRRKNAPVPDGGVLSPKTLDELALENDQGVRAAEEVLSGLYRDTE